MRGAYDFAECVRSSRIVRSCTRATPNGATAPSSHGSDPARVRMPSEVSTASVWRVEPAGLQAVDLSQHLRKHQRPCLRQRVAFCFIGEDVKHAAVLGLSSAGPCDGTRWLEVFGQRGIVRTSCPILKSDSGWPSKSFNRPRMSPPTLALPSAFGFGSVGGPSAIAIEVRGGVLFVPLSSGHWLTESMGGSPARLATGSCGSTPAMSA